MRREGTFGVLPAEIATSLVMVLNELLHQRGGARLPGRARIAGEPWSIGGWSSLRTGSASSCT